MKLPRWCLFYDFHTMPKCPQVGEKFDFDMVTDKIKECGVDYIVFPAKCNLGMAYYDTKTGIKHPSLKRDLLGEFAEACRKKGIGISAYMNVGLSHEEGLLHREWTVVTPEGYAYQPPMLQHWFRRMCFNTGYAERTLAMIKELLEGYPLDGFFFDSMSVYPCIGEECMKEMKKEGYDWKDESDLHDFAEEKLMRMAKRISSLIKSHDKEKLVFFNGIPAEKQAEAGSTYLEFECLPTGGWGYEYAPIMMRYLRTLGLHVVNMTGRFHESWGDFGGIRTEASLEYDCISGMAHCLQGVTIGDHFHPRGDLNLPVFDLVKKTYSKLKTYEPWTRDASAVTDIAMLFEDWDSEKPGQAVTGATRMLAELKTQFDVTTLEAGIGKYKLALLPDFVALDEDAVLKIRGFLDNGGAVLSSAWSGLDPERRNFALKDWGLEFLGDSPHDPAYISVGQEVGAGVPEMPFTLYEKGTEVKATGAGVKILSRVVAPFFNKEWDGEHANLYTPPDGPTNSPALAQNGRVAHFSHPFFLTYYHHAQVPMRTLLGNLLDRLLPEPALRVKNMPSFARATVAQQPGRRMVHLLSYVPERRGSKIEMIEEPVELRDVEVSLRLDGLAVKKAYLAPDGTKLDFKIENGRAKATVPAVNGYALVVFEE